MGIIQSTGSSQSHQRDHQMPMISTQRTESTANQRMFTLFIAWAALCLAEVAMARIAPGAPSPLGTAAELGLLLTFAGLQALIARPLPWLGGPFTPGVFMLLGTALYAIATKGLILRRYPLSPGDLILVLLCAGFVGAWIEKKAPKIAPLLAIVAAPLFVAAQSLALGFYKGGRATALQMMGEALVYLVPALIVIALIAHFKRPLAPIAAGLAALALSLGNGAKNAAESGPPPVILITVDTLRFDEAINMSSYQTLARDGLEFVDALAPSGWTLPSMGSIATGMWPNRHGAHRLNDTWPSHGMINPQLPTLGETMKGAGYQTAGMVSNPNLDGQFGFKRGMDKWHNLFRDPPTLFFGLSLLGREANLNPLYPSPHDGGMIIDESLRFIDARSEHPFFLWVHNLDCHLPYYHTQISQTSPLYTTFGPKPTKMLNVPMLRMGRLWYNTPMRDALLGLYRNEINYIDGHINRLITQLKARGIYDEALIIFTSDHGEEFLDHGSYEHGHTVYDELIHIPMVVKLPQSKTVGIKETPVSLVDILPTIAEVAKIQLPAEIQGVSMLQKHAPSRPRFLLGNLYNHQVDGVVVGDWKLVQEDGLDDNLKLYHRGEGEMEDVADINPEIVNQLAALLQKRGGEEADEPELDIDGLKALGYMD